MQSTDKRFRISSLFSEGCVLQRGRENKISGHAHRGSKIMLRARYNAADLSDGTECVAAKEVEVWCRADEKGRFELCITPTAPAEGVTLIFEEWEEKSGKLLGRHEVRDAAFGDVFLLCGQSNMALPVARTLDVTKQCVEKNDYPYIREFVVPMEPVFGKELSEVAGGTWKRARGKEILSFSAAGFFMAERLYEKYHVPIGLIQTAVGGTPIQAWCSEKTIRELEEYTEEMEQCFDADWVAGIQKAEAEAEKLWHEKAWQMSESQKLQMSEEKESVRRKEESMEGTVAVPGLWKDTVLQDFHGSIILERDFWLEEEPAEQEENVRAYIGAIVDADRVFVNGYLIGETGYCYPPRKYDFPASILKKGRNNVRIEMMVFRGTGGFIPDKPYYIGYREQGISMEGFWKYRIVKQMSELPQTTFFQYKPTALYNGMLAPLRGAAVKAFIFYQGESNTHKPEGYQRYFDRALMDWRELFQAPSLPVVYVQLAGFADSCKPCTDTSWAVLREEQRQSLHNSHTAMTVALDLGEYNDLHPQRKAELGERIALAVDALAFGGQEEYSGPVCLGMERTGREVRLRFSHAEGGLVSSGGGRKIYETELAGEDGIFYEAEAYVEGNCLYASSDYVQTPCFCRYAWNNFPERPNLFNSSGLPASPFSMRLEEG